MKIKIYQAVVATTAFFVASCGSKKNEENVQMGPDPIVAHIDSTVQPGADFFNFANGTWFKNHPIPESETTNGIFLQVRDTVNAAIRSICENAAKQNNTTKGSNTQKIGDFFFSGMDTLSIDKAGVAPLQEELAKIAYIKTADDLLKEVSELQKIQVAAMFSIGVGRDDKNSNKYAVQLWQGGLGLPERDYYLSNDPTLAKTREEYKKLIVTFLKALGDDEAMATKSADDIYALESKLARASRKMEDLRDPYKNYNKFDIAKFNASTPHIRWKEMTSGMGIQNVDTVIVGQPEFYKALDGLITATKIDVWKQYLKWCLINTYASYLTADIRKANWQFYEGELSGAKKQKPRWKEVVDQTNTYLGELVGQVYVENHLPKGTKEKLIEIGKNIMQVYGEHLKKLDWMSDATKEKALYKLSKVNMKLGYPDKWKDYSALNIDRNAYCKNVMEAHKWMTNYNVSKYGKPMDRSEWNMTPQTYNAYYDPTLNEIVIPACNIIVPGYAGLPSDAVLYGIVGGSTFGHEITHGFDDQGSQYSAEGNLQDWWTKEDREKFNAKTKLMVEQFNQYTVNDSLHVRGQATLGENIADLGGVVMGYEAFKKTVQGKGTEKQANGLTPDQEYFLGYGYAWMVQRRPEALRKQIMTDVHSPSQWRINGPLANIPEFYKAFNIKKGDAMYREDSLRVLIW
jgi:putative endopeptidase